MQVKEILSKVDHTTLLPTATFEDIRLLCDEALEFHTASVCIPPSYVKQASEYVSGKIPICTVIGFPNGYSTSDSKCYEAKGAILNGANELDMVINLGFIKQKLYNKQLDEIKMLKDICQNRVLKVIIETCLLTKDEKITLCDIVSKSGADYIKTSTGFSVSGATFEDVALLKSYVSNKVKVKAAGGISSLEDAQKFIRLGADRLGTSKIIKILKQQDFSYF